MSDEHEWYPKPKGLYHPRFEHGSCGVGLVADISGRRSHRILQLGLEALARLNHRGALAADGRSGDGSGILAALPEKFFGAGRAVGVLFIPGDPGPVIERVSRRCQARNLAVVNWRPVPMDLKLLGERAQSSLPAIYHLVVEGDISDTNLYRTRKEIEKEENCYLPSFSSRVIVYKGLLMAVDLKAFYEDLNHPDFQTHFVLFHQRYSTNTFPSWPLAQPFRLLAHNGEINTLSGNRIWTLCRQALVGSSRWGKDREWLFPIIQEDGSDSMSLDNLLEFFTLSGRDLFHSVMALIPQAWENDPDLPPDLRAFYQYHACFQEPWDGPAAIVFTDGYRVGAALDRNGFRPLRYSLTREGLLVVGSEMGILDLDPYAVIEKGNCRPGEILGVDFRAERFLRDADIKDWVSRRKPYQSWLDCQLRTLPSHPLLAVAGRENQEQFFRKQKALGYSVEEWEYILEPMAVEGKEPTGSMGDDCPLAVLSLKERPLFHYFRQRFAQVTNPAMDPLREASVVSLQLYLGPGADPLDETPLHAQKILLEHPFLTSAELERLKSMAPHQELDTCFRAGEKLEEALDRLVKEALRAAAAGKWLLVLSDRAMDAERIPIPSPLVTGFLHHGLLECGVRGQVELVVDSAEVRDDHHVAVLLGYGASAVCPYLVVEALEKPSEVDNYCKAILSGLRKIMSKMGICTLSGYRGAQIFEILGLSCEVVDKCFKGTFSPIEGIGFEQIASEVVARHRAAYDGDSGQLPLGGFHRYRKGEEHHDFHPELVQVLHAVAAGEDGAYARFQEIIRHRPPVALRDLLDFRPRTPVPLEEVEPVESLCRRFATAAMSLGALSPEAHETLAIAMNRMGGKSNTGEGGEDPQRLRTRGLPEDRNSKVKQVASARFGVTPEYLVSAEELQIKIAQGSKPGEGGQLPGHKVDQYIARLRHARPGTALISPPPHHDIYSIEDLAQLICDLKEINPEADVSVKLVSESGVGTIAAGVAKAGATSILISGHVGGTGASPRGSIKYAGTPWELGLAETHQVLRLNGLRSRVRLTADGGIKSGRDIVVAALLGAEQFGFGSAALVAAGCVMARVCHKNTCPAGVATQNPKLRKKFPHDPDRVVRYLRSVADEVRHLLAQLGFRTLQEAVGRSEVLVQREIRGHPKAHAVDLGRLLYYEECPPQSEGIPRPLGEPSLRNAAVQAVRENRSLSVYFPIRNTMRSMGADLAGLIAGRRLEGKPYHAEIQGYFHGTAGLSFGCFTEAGMRLTLIGEANDYAGKGMGGGMLILRPPDGISCDTSRHCIVGNTVLYGATGGEFYAAGRAGQRFAVRNSGAVAVVEGVGDHGCEYMTAGKVVILGPTGKNFGAGMTGGVAFVFDEKGTFLRHANREAVSLEVLTGEVEQKELYELVGRHQQLTNSAKAAQLLENWAHSIRLFWKVVPRTEACAAALPEVAEAVPTGTWGQTVSPF